MCTLRWLTFLAHPVYYGFNLWLRPDPLGAVPVDPAGYVFRPQKPVGYPPYFKPCLRYWWVRVRVDLGARPLGITNATMKTVNTFPQLAVANVGGLWGLISRLGDWIIQDPLFTPVNTSSNEKRGILMKEGECPLSPNFIYLVSNMRILVDRSALNIFIFLYIQNLSKCMHDG